MTNNSGKKESGPKKVQNDSLEKSRGKGTSESDKIAKELRDLSDKNG